MQVKSKKTARMKNFLSLLVFCVALPLSHANQILSNLAMEDGCKRGAQDGAQVAVLVEKAVAELINSTPPQSTKRKNGLNEIMDIGKKKEDEYNDKTEKEQASLIARGESEISDFYKRQIFKSNVEIRFTAMQTAYEMGILKGFENGTSNVTSSESRYRREIENQCRIIFSSK